MIFPMSSNRDQGAIILGLKLDANPCFFSGAVSFFTIQQLFQQEVSSGSLLHNILNIFVTREMQDKLFCHFYLKENSKGTHVIETL